MGYTRRPNGSIVGANNISLTTYPTTISGIWDKNEHASLVSANLWSGYGGLSLSYNFTSNIATIIFNGGTVKGLVGGTGSGPGGGPGGIGGSYSITGSGYSNSGGVNGGTGPSGGAASFSPGGASIGTDTDLQSIASNLSYSNFGSGGSGAQVNGGNINGGPGYFAGGGGGGGATASGGNQPPGGAGSNAGIAFKYIAQGTTYYQIVNQSAGSGSFTLPGGTVYVKIWAIGHGGDGGTGGGGTNVCGAGGGGGGIGWAEFT
jgi:hypothetical protein